MSLFDKPLLQVTENDLLALISDKAGEGKTLEYKRDAVGQSDSDRKEFLYDASSFANTQGGHLIFGVEEENGLPTKLLGIGNIETDRAILRLEQMLRDGIRPPISGVETVPVTLTTGDAAIVMRIPKSWNPPHQVTFQKAFRFYARDSNGKYQVDVDELRSVFAVSGTIADRIRDFRADRTAKVAAGDTPVALLDGGYLLLYVVPFSAFSVGNTFPFHRAAEEPNKFPALFDTFARRSQVTFDGLLITSDLDALPKPLRAYTQLLRSGAVEAVSALAHEPNQDWLILPTIEATIVRYSKLYMRALHGYGVEPQIAIFTSLIHVKGMRLLQHFPQTGAFSKDLPSVRLSRDQFHFVETIIGTIPADDKETAERLRGTIDHLANAAGLASSLYFDAQGNYTMRILDI